MSWRLKYTMVEQRGFGGFGTVYVVHDVWGRRLALKVLNERTWDFVRGFQREAAKLYELQGIPGVVQLIDHDLHCAEPYIVLELAEQSLHDLLAGKPQPLGRAAAIGLQLARAVRNAHSRGVLHCDLKPRNILVMGQGVLKITDFGAAKGIASVFLTVGPTGTEGYMAPEQAHGVLSAAADVFGLGATLYEVLTGRVPPIRTSDLDPRWLVACPPDLATFIQLMTAAAPQGRPTLVEAEAFFRDFMAREQGRAAAAAREAQQRANAAKQSAAPTITFGAAAVLALIFEAPLVAAGLAGLALLTAASKR